MISQNVRGGQRGDRSIADGARPGSQAPQQGAGLAGLATYGNLRAPLPSDQELAELRRQQAALHGLTGRLELDPRNSWLAAGALAPPLLALGLEGAGAWAARSTLPAARKTLLNLTEREPLLRVGDNWATRAGQRAHEALKRQLDQKPGWKYEPKMPQSGGRPLKPDVGAPVRDPKSDKRYLMELKPNTPSGRRAAARAKRKYESQTLNKTRPIYYNPDDYM
jgi:hypothetical protein